MKREVTKPIVVECLECKFPNVFNQPYSYHAGFGNQGFLYNEKGNRTLIWSSFDKAYEGLVGNFHPWVLSAEKQKLVEDALLPDPAGGGRWLFSNPPRCLKCGHRIGDSIRSTIYYLEYDGSINLDPLGNPGRGLREMIR